MKKPNEPIVTTRFAPSPTGFLHIGGARTALFNWLYAKHMNGRMLLRIEDTDRERSTKEAVDAIVNGLQWLGIDWEGEVISQFERADRHREVALQLLSKGKAYYCYSSAEELAQMRKKARTKGESPCYDSRWRDHSPSLVPFGVKPVIRIKVPRDGKTVVRDKVQGTIAFLNRDLDDFIILRSNGTPTYMLAVVVDDHDMGISHIIRGDDHLTNAARQTILYEAMEWEIPVMAHIPLIHGSNGSKLSKRHGALGINAYRRMGFVPVALRNYLVRLGWSHSNDEIMSTEDIIRWFDIADINKGAARFDIKKLEAMNGYYLRTVRDEELFEHIVALFPQNFEQQYPKLYRAIPGLKKRSKTLCELVACAGFIFAKRPLQMEDKALAFLSDEGKTILRDILPFLKHCSTWESAELEKRTRSYAERTALKLLEIAQPLRAALTGCTRSPSVFEVLEILGRDEALARIEDQIKS